MSIKKKSDKEDEHEITLEPIKIGGFLEELLRKSNPPSKHASRKKMTN
jgi:hypothetical protein